MQQTTNHSSQYYFDNISSSKLSIYDPIDVGDPSLWIPSKELEQILNEKLVGASLDGLPIRTRSKVLKQKVCQALGYAIPSTFKKTHPRFPGQNFDTYTQKSNNLQVWNEGIDPTRRYVIPRLNDNNIIIKVKVITGEDLALLDKTGTLTKKYQARVTFSDKTSELISTEDTQNLKSFGVNGVAGDSLLSSPINLPSPDGLLPIEGIFNKLVGMVNMTFDDAGIDQERNRGGALHRLVLQKLGFRDYKDNGKFPDILNQLVEVKLQTSPTIDLGLVCPDSNLPLDIPAIGNVTIKHNDIRYAIFFATTNGTMVKITHFFLTTGESFFKRFTKFQGKVVNSKIQIPLPKELFT